MPKKSKHTARTKRRKAVNNGPADGECENLDSWLRLTPTNRLPQGCSPAKKRAALEMLAEMHGVKPIDNPAGMTAPFWPNDESTDEMLAALRAIRRGQA